MPISAAVKIDFFAKQSIIDLDIRLEPVALTHEQCIQYQLPRTPIKATETRLAGFEARYGEGATELDALQALHPGALREILLNAIMRYYDVSLARNVADSVDDFTSELHDADAEVEEQFAEEIADINNQRDQIAAAFAEVHGPALDAYARIMRLARARYQRALDSVRAEVMAMEEPLGLAGGAHAYADEHRARGDHAGPGPIRLAMACGGR